MTEHSDNLQRAVGASPAALSEKGEPRRDGKRYTYAHGDSPLLGYTIKRGIGIGGFGEVYFAVSDGGKEVALKLIRRNLDVELRGASHCLNLKHANLLSLHDIRRDERDDAWLVMELVTGESLTQAIDRFPQGMSANEARGWFVGIAAAVAYLHDRGIVHRDLKPGNIFRDEGVVKLGDYGLAKFLSCSRRSGQTESVGTCHYMAPEIGRGSYGKEIDIYALGAVLYEMLTGHVPFEGESSQEILLKHLTAPPDLKGIAEPQRSVIARAMAKDPSERFGSVNEMTVALGWLPRETWSSSAPPAAVLPPAQSGVSSADRCPPVATHWRREQEKLGDAAMGNAAMGGAAHVAGAENVAPAGPKADIVTRAVHAVGKEISAAWNETQLPGWARLLLLVVGCFLLGLGCLFLMKIASSMALILLPFLFLLGAGYLVYCFAYSVVMSFRESWSANARPFPSSAPDVARAVPAPARHAWHSTTAHERWQQNAREILGRRSFVERASDVLAAMLAAVPISAVLAVPMLLIGGISLEGGYSTWCLGAWLATTTTLGAWAIIAISKAWEGTIGDEVWRRFILLVAGLALGTLSQRIGSELLIDWATVTWGRRLPIDATAFVGFFAGLFVALRWWHQADPLRSARVSIWAALMCVLWAWLLNFMWPFSQPWGVLLAGSISLTVQLATSQLNSAQISLIRPAPEN